MPFKLCKQCDGPVCARGLCRHHYNVARRKGTLLQHKKDHSRIRAPRQSLFDRLFSKIRVLPNDCWEWTGFKRSDGYGHIWLVGPRSTRHRVHRVMYELYHGEELKPTEMFCHRCDNPSCVNPEHGFIGTRADNIQDCVAKGRNQFGAKHWRAKLTIEQVKAIRADHVSTNRELADRYGVQQPTISRIKTGRRWQTALARGGLCHAI